MAEPVSTTVVAIKGIAWLAGVCSALFAGYALGESKRERQRSHAESMQILRRACNEARRRLHTQRTLQPHGKNAPPILSSYRGGKSACGHYEEYRFDVDPKDIDLRMATNITQIVLWIKMPFDDSAKPSARIDYDGDHYHLGSYEEFEPQELLDVMKKKKLASRPSKPPLTQMWT